MRCQAKLKSRHQCRRTTKSKYCWQHKKKQRGGANSTIRCNRTKNRNEFICNGKYICNRDPIDKSKNYLVYACPKNADPQLCDLINQLQVDFTCHVPKLTNISDHQMMDQIMRPDQKYAIYTGEYDKPTKNFQPSILNYAGNPSGIWYACGNSWLEFLEYTGFRDSCCFLYQVREAPGAKILKIQSLQALFNFSIKYAKDKTVLPLEINWNRVRQDGYDGIQVCPSYNVYNLYEQGMIKQYAMVYWYQPNPGAGFANVDSGVVWNVNALEHKLFAFKKSAQNKWNVYFV